MATQEITNINAHRVELGKALPLEAPFSVQMYIANVCNFKCNYCLQGSNPSTLNHMPLPKKFMDFDCFKKCIDGFVSLKTKLKVLVLVGWGEPLLHPDIVAMIKYVKVRNVTDKVEILTNASKLTPDLSDQLIEVGLDSIRISLQGLSSESYKQVSKVEINFDKIVSNIKYFYEHKKHTKVYIKIIDTMLNEQENKELFYNIFGGICDEIAVESLIPVLAEFDYSKSKREFLTGLLGNKIVDTDICALPFYSCIIDVEGNVLPCCVFPPPAKFANVTEESLDKIWNGAEYHSFLIKMLKKEKPLMHVCKECKRHIHVMHPSDYLDNYANELLHLYNK